MELKDYQTRALETFDRWYETLRRAQERARAKIAEYEAQGLAYPPDLPNYPQAAWCELAAQGELPRDEKGRARPYIARHDAVERPIPHTCFKVPTGGGKTLLAAAALGRIQRPRGLVLWVVPSRAIYEQTRAALWDRQHPYRQRLEAASAGRLKLLEKDDPFSALDHQNCLCLMLLMLPAANRQRNREFLRIFRDSGRYPAFFPADDNPLADAVLLQKHPDLERASAQGPVKQSLFNVIKRLRPVVILDEAHKAYGRKTEQAQEFARAINRLNPRLVLEFSATPHERISNVLVDISGLDLKNEEMIKLPVRVTSFMGAKWQNTLERAHEQLGELAAAAQSLQQRSGRHIRPIAVVRVERTGAKQRDGVRVHAEDVREYLQLQLAVPATAIRVKSSQRDELGREDLLSEECPVRWIITKDALKEGWDCPFAYLLVLLDNTQAPRALTQLVGRVLRQPQARQTDEPLLNQSHVHCWDIDVGRAVEQVKAGLENEGLTGLMGEVASAEDWDNGKRYRRLRRRETHQGEEEIRLPKVMHRAGAGWCELDHTQHIIAEIPWREIAPPPIQQPIPTAAQEQVVLVDVGYGAVRTKYHDPLALAIDKTLSLEYFARRLAELVPNPWQAAQFARDLMERLRAAGQSDEMIFDQRAHYAETLRRHLAKEIDRLAERLFREKLRKGDIAVRETHPMPEELELPLREDDSLLTRYGEPVQRSLFEKVYDKQFDSQLERKFAFHLEDQLNEPNKAPPEGERAEGWWHRVIRQGQADYYLRGWRRGRIYPDFIAWRDHTYIFETKGEHLRDNEDTTYKKRVFNALQAAFNSQASPKATLIENRGTFSLVFDAEFPALR